MATMDRNPNHCICQGYGWFHVDGQYGGDEKPCDFHQGDRPHPFAGVIGGPSPYEHRLNQLRETFTYYKIKAMEAGYVGKGSFNAACLAIIEADEETPTPERWVDAAESICADAQAEAYEHQQRTESDECSTEFD